MINAFKNICIMHYI